MSYAPDEDRSVVARLAVFTHTVKRLDDEPLKSGSLLHPYHCLLVDLCKQNGVPRFDWNQPGKNGISLISMRTENMDVQFRDDDPCVVQVRKKEFETTKKSEFLGALVDIDGLIMVLDVGITGEEDYEDQMLAICALVADAKNLFDKAEQLTPKNFHTPCAVMSATLGGRVSNRNRQTVADLTADAGWLYSYISTLHNELDIGAMIVALAERIHKRGPTRYRLVPGMVRASPESPLPIPVRPAITPKETGPVEQLSPGDSPSIVTPYIERFPMPDLSTAPPLPISSSASPMVVSSSSGSIAGMAEPAVTPQKPKNGRLPTPIPQLSRPVLTSSRSGGSLSTTASSRSLRAAPLPAPLAEEAPPPVPPLVLPAPAKVETPPATQPTEPEQRLNIQISAPLPAVDRSAVLAATLARTRATPDAPIDPMDETVPEPYIPYISDVEEEGSFYNRYRQPRPAPVPPASSTSRTVEPWFDMEGPNVPTGSPKGSKSLKGFFARWGRSKSAKGNPAKRPALHENTFLTPLSPGPARPPAVDAQSTISGSQRNLSVPATSISEVRAEPPDSTLASSSGLATPATISMLTDSSAPAPIPVTNATGESDYPMSPSSTYTMPSLSPRRAPGMMRALVADIDRDREYEQRFGVTPESDDRVFTGATFERMEREKAQGCCLIG